MISSVSENLAAVRGRIARACDAARRDPAGVRLVAVSKAFGPEPIVAALAAGQADFGESYLQEALPKLAAVPRDGVTWHFVGPVQGNKTAGIARHFDWVHGVDRERIARRLSAQRPAELPPLNVCVQVKVSAEPGKSGVPPQEAGSLCRAVAALPRLRLRGIMAIPAPLDTVLRTYSGRTDWMAAAREPYRRLRELYDTLCREGLDLDTLSAGMSDDFEAAIAEGSTLVRIGTAIFGGRP